MINEVDRIAGESACLKALCSEHITVGDRNYEKAQRLFYDGFKAAKEIYHSNDPAGRLCVAYKKWKCRWIMAGLGVGYPDGRNAAVITVVYVERLEDGQIVPVEPERVQFITEEKPDPLADGSGDAHNNINKERV